MKTPAPADVADVLVAEAAKAATHAMAQYPHDRTERLAYEAAQLRTLITVVAHQLRDIKGWA